MVFVKKQKNKKPGTEDEYYGPYYYLYQTYYKPGMEYPTNFKVGKVDDSIDSIMDNYREKADSKDLDVSADEFEEFRDKLEHIDENANSVEEKAEMIKEYEQDPENHEEEESEEESENDADSSEKSYGGIGGGRRKKLDKIDDFDNLKTLEKSDIDSKEDVERFIEDMSVAGVASARGSHVDLQDLLDRLDKMYSNLPNDEARNAYVNDNKLYKTLRSTRRHFNKLIDKERSFAEMPSAVEAGPAKYPTGKRDKKRKSLRKQKEKVEEKVDRLYGRLKGARQRALQSIGSSVGEQNEKRRADTREEQRERFEKDMMAEFFHGITSYGRIKRVNKKSVTFEYWRNKPREEGYELDTLRIDMPSNRYSVVESVKLTEDAVKEIDEETYNLILDMDESEVPETVDADFLEEIKSEEEEDSKKEQEEPEETVVLKKENEKGEIKEYDVPESKAKDRADALIDAPHGTVEKIWIDGEVYYERDENEEDEGMNEEAVKKLTSKGVMVGKDASEIITDDDVEMIMDIEALPMYVDENVLREIKGEDVSVEYDDVEITGEVPEFYAIDGDIYGNYDGEERVTLPDDNAEILVNRGLAERVEEEEDSSVKNEGNRNEEMIEKFGELGAINVYLYRNNSEVPKQELEEKFGRKKVERILEEDGFDITTHGGEKHVLQLSEEFERAEELIRKNENDKEKENHEKRIEIGKKFEKKEFPQNIGEWEKVSEDDKSVRWEMPEEDFEYITLMRPFETDQIKVKVTGSEIEKNKFESIESALEYIRKFADSSDNEDKEDDSMDTEDGYVEVEFLQKTPQFMGTDLEQYGGFEKGDVAEIPEDNAEILENRGNVEVKGGVANVAEEHNQSSRDKNGSDSSSKRNFEGKPDGFDRLREKVMKWIRENETEDKGAVIDDLTSRPEGIMAWAEIEGFSEDQVMDALDSLKREGQLFEPSQGRIKTI